MSKEDAQIISAHRSSSSSLDLGSSSNTSQGVTDLAQQTTPRSLHKAASMTFQSVSDAIRSKAYVFYATPEKADSEIVDHKADTPKSHRPRSSGIISLAKSREGFGSLDYRLGSGRGSPRPMIIVTNPLEMSPTINGESSTEVSYQRAKSPKLKSYGPPRRLWPTPVDVAFQQFSKIDLSAASVAHSPLIGDSYVETSEDFMYDTAMFDPVSGVPSIFSEDQNPATKDNFDLGYSVGATVLGPSPPMSNGTAVFDLVSRSPFAFFEDQDPTMKDNSDLGYSVGAGIFSPSRPISNGTAKVDLVSRFPSTFLEDQDPTMNDSSDLGYSVGAGIFTSSPSVNNKAAMKSKEPETMEKETAMKTKELQTANTPSSKRIERPIFHRMAGHKNGLKDLVPSINGSPNDEGQEHETPQSSKSVYGSDDEKRSPGAPAMGSRREWDKVRADRFNRYSAIRFLDDGEKSDSEKTEEDLEFGLELEKFPAREPLEDALRTLTEFDTDDSSEGFDSTFTDDEIAESLEKTSESPYKHEDFLLKLAESDVYDEYKPNEGSPSDLPVAKNAIDAEAALDRLCERKQDWSSVSSYDSEDELSVLYERPGDVASFPAGLAPIEHDQKDKSADTEKPDHGFTLSAQQSDILVDTSKENREETDSLGYRSVDSGIACSPLSNTDEQVPGSTALLPKDALEENDGCIEGILSENECSPLDESPIYTNPGPFPDLKEEDSDDESLPSGIIERALTDQVDRRTLVDKQEANPRIKSSYLFVNAFEGFWPDLGQDLRGSLAQYLDTYQNGQNYGENGIKESQDFADGLLRELEGMIRVGHESDDPERAFNAARLPMFNLVSSPGPMGGEQENQINGATDGHCPLCPRSWPTAKLIKWPQDKPPYQRDQSILVKIKEGLWADDIEIFEELGATLPDKAGKSNGVKVNGNSPGVFLDVPQKPVLEDMMPPLWLGESDEVTNGDHRDW